MQLIFLTIMDKNRHLLPVSPAQWLPGWAYSGVCSQRWWETWWQEKNNKLLIISTSQWWCFLLLLLLLPLARKQETKIPSSPRWACRVHDPAKCRTHPSLLQQTNQSRTCKDAKNVFKGAWTQVSLRCSLAILQVLSLHADANLSRLWHCI